MVALRDRGVRPVTVNTWLCALNAFCRWLHEEGTTLREPVRLRRLKVERRLVKRWTRSHCGGSSRSDRRTIRNGVCRPLWQPSSTRDARIDEVLSSRVRDLDLANTLLTVIGKGDKQRIVPFSFELRKRLVRFGQVKAQQEVPGEWMFPARDGGKWHQRNALRSYYLLLKRLGLPRSGFHLLRHSFATQYLKARGDVVRLSRVLRHSGIGTTMRYVHLVTTDLQAPHQRLSILNRLR